MSGPFVLRRALTVGSLVGVWCVLWGSVSVANVLTGLAVLLGLEVLRLRTGRRDGIRLIPLSRLVWMVAKDLVESTLVVGRETLRKENETREAIIAVPVTLEARRHLLLLIIAITVTPGTAVVDSDHGAGVLYLHLLDLQRRAQVESHVTALADLACAALPSQAGDGPETTKAGVLA